MPLLATPPDQRLTPGLLSGHKAHLSKSPAAFAFLASVRSRLDAPRCQNQPSIPGRPEARRPASLVTTGLSHGSKQDTLACPPHPARNSSTSLKSLSRPGEHHLARRSQGPPSPLPPAPANEQPPRVSNSVSDHNSYISPSLLQGNILPNPPPSPTIDSHSQGSFLNGGSGAGP